MNPRWRSTAGSITWPRDRPGHPGDQPELALVFVARLPGRPQLVQERVRRRGRGPTRPRRRLRRLAALSIATEAPGAIVPR